MASVALSLPRSRRPLPKGYVPRLPHPSWRPTLGNRERQAERAVSTAVEFWDRLGI